jgi:N utilization substance protein A
VVQELRGERIDIVPWSPDAARYVCSALSPAQVAKVIIDEAERSMDVVVPDDQLSLAIGRGGQNVRLAAQLTGWNLDIISETRLKNLMAEARSALLAYEGITEDAIDTLFTLGYNKLEHIAHAAPQELAQIPGFGTEKAEKIVAAASEILTQPEPEPEEVARMQREQKELLKIAGVGERMAKMLHNAGYRIPRVLLIETSAERTDAKSGIGVKKARQILEAVEELFKADESVDWDEVAEQREKFAAELAEVEVANVLDAYEKHVGPALLPEFDHAENETHEEA